MKKQEIVKRTVEYVRKELEKDTSGHDWFHTERVWKTASFIAKKENADLFVVELAALSHDVADWKFSGSVEEGQKKASEWLESLGLEEEFISRVCRIIGEVSFKGAGVETVPTSLEGRVVQDADRLDAIGAIGIARVFAFGASRGRQIHNPKIEPERHETFEEYKKGAKTSINHFYEKLLLLRDLMNTETAKKIADKRHAFMKEYLEEFFREWNCKFD